jgi:hypothetical protein
MKALLDEVRGAMEGYLITEDDIARILDPRPKNSVGFLALLLYTKISI